MLSSIKEQTKRLWKASFDDTDNFVELYFDRVFHTDINHTIEYEGRVVAALQAIPFLFKAGDKILKTAYLSGITTDADYRRQGFMGRLLDDTHRKLRDSGFDAAFLIPAKDFLFDIYAKFGYRTAFYKDYQKINITSEYKGNNQVNVSSLAPSDISEAFRYFDYKQRQQTAGVIFDKRYFETVVDVFAMENNKVLIAKTDNRIAGIAFADTEGNVLKLFADSSDIEQAIFYDLAKIICKRTILLKTNGKAIPYGMIKPLTDNTLPDDILPSVSLMLDE